MAATKKMALALAEGNIQQSSFDDFVVGKGKGMVVLLQYALLNLPYYS